jgi:AcrR family transcriptional regulator
MPNECQEVLDPRIRRTRQLLHQALANLMQTKEFDKISVQDITDAATLNRATFYDHYPDKFALLKAMVGARFHELLNDRGVHYEGGCPSALRAIVLGVCDYLASLPGIACERQMEPHMESAVIDVVRRLILDGLNRHPPVSIASREIISTTVSWAIYGAASEWVHTPGRCASNEIAKVVVALVAPIISTEQ